jgi:hypothetical protein
MIFVKLSIKLACDDLAVKFILYILKFPIKNKLFVKRCTTIDFLILLPGDVTVAREHRLASHEEKVLLLYNLHNSRARISVNTSVDHEESGWYPINKPA